MAKIKEDSSFDSLKESVYKDDPEGRKYYEKMRPLREFQELIIETRVRAGLSQAELADELNTTQSCISRLESGDDFNPEFRTLIKLIHVLVKNTDNNDDSSEFYEAFKQVLKRTIQESSTSIEKKAQV